MKRMILLAFLFCSSLAWGQGTWRPQSDRASQWTYDLSASTGSQNDVTYTEINLGLNWRMQDWLVWRNALFSRQSTGASQVMGLDSSMRLTGDMQADNGAWGVNAFVGPGVRAGTQKHSAVFGEAGLVFRLGGLRIGAGAKSLKYFEDRELNNVRIPKDETQYFLILGGGGAL